MKYVLAVEVKLIRHLDEPANMQPQLPMPAMMGLPYQAGGLDYRHYEVITVPTLAFACSILQEFANTINQITVLAGEKEPQECPKPKTQ